MLFLPIEAVSYDDEGFPGVLECVFIDAYGQRHIVFEKEPCVWGRDFFKDSVYPCRGFVSCEIEREWTDDRGLSVAHIRTELCSDEKGFIVLRSELTEDPNIALAP